MQLLKEGYPDEGDLALCTVTKIHFHSVFVKLDEFEKSGMIHISEVSPGRIRNLRDFVEEGKVIVCKVLAVNKDKGHIDLSLRRVSEGQRRQKVDEMKKQQKAEKIIEFIAKQSKKDFKQLYDNISEKILDKYETLYDCFEDVVDSNFAFEDLEIDKAIAGQLSEVVKQRIKPLEVEIKGHLLLKSYEPDGVDIVKGALKKGVDKGGESVKITYAGAGKYNLQVKSSNYKDAEKTLKNSTEAAVKFIEKKGGEGSFVRIEKSG